MRVEILLCTLNSLNIPDKVARVGDSWIGALERSHRLPFRPTHVMIQTWGTNGVLTKQKLFLWADFQGQSIHDEEINKAIRANLWKVG